MVVKCKIYNIHLKLENLSSEKTQQVFTSELFLLDGRVTESQVEY